MDRIINYLDRIFKNLPNTSEVIKAKNELAQMMEDKLNELLEEGVSEDDAVEQVISEFGNVDEIAEELGLSKEQAQDIRNQINGNYGQYGGAGQYGNVNGATGYSPYAKAEKTKWWVVVLIVLAVLAALFLVIIVLTTVLGVSAYTKHESSSMASLSMIEGDMDVDDFTSIDIDAAMGSVAIETGDTYHVYYNYPERYVPTIEVKNDQLVIQDKKNRDISLFSNFNNFKCEIVVTVPKDAKLTKSDLDLDMGSAELSDLCLGDTVLKADMGSIDVTNCSMESCTAGADMGSIVLSECTFTIGDFDASMGSIELKNTSFDKADLEADMGSIEVDGEYNEITGDCSMGDITVNDKDKDAKYDLNCDMGSVSVNGKDQGDKYSN